MTRINSLRHEFVTYIPDTLDHGVLYVSTPFAIVVHSCCCGCENEIVTPLDPQDWEMTFNGRSVSLSPSIGNGSLACESHYWVHRNQVEWLPRLSKYDMKAGQGSGSSKMRRRFRSGWLSLWRTIQKRLRQTGRH